MMKELIVLKIQKQQSYIRNKLLKETLRQHFIRLQNLNTGIELLFTVLHRTSKV